ncbi:phage tail sheath C-terminal domain-containing protein [Pseudomonas aeruginosa]|nr:phage tail sheath C-terminal domain-containing protein [Pseudomonas aeruginosa]
MNIQFDQIPASIRKPGVYIEFNTRLAVRTLPANKQRVCLFVPLGDEATVPAATPHQVFSDDQAQKLYGSDVAAGMTRAAIAANPYLDLTLVGVDIKDKLPDLAAALAATVGGGYHILVPAWFDAATLTALRAHIQRYTDGIEQQSLIAVAASTGTLSAATTLADSLNSGAITLALLPWQRDPRRAHRRRLCRRDRPRGRPGAPAQHPGPDRRRRTAGGPAPGPQRTGSRPGQRRHPLEVGPGEVVQIVRAITTYTKSPTGADDIALLDLTTIRTLYYVRQACRDRIRLRFPREKLSDRKLPDVRSELLDVLKKLEELEIVEAVGDNADGLIVQRSLQDPNRVDARIPTDVVNGLHVFAGRIDLLL